MLHALIYFSTIVWILLRTVVLLVTNRSGTSKWSCSILLSLLQTELFLCCFVLFNKRLFSPGSFITIGIQWYNKCQWIVSAKVTGTREFLSLGDECWKFEFTQTIQESWIKRNLFFCLPRVIWSRSVTALFVNMIVKLFREMYCW